MVAGVAVAKRTQLQSDRSGWVAGVSSICGVMRVDLCLSTRPPNRPGCGTLRPFTLSAVVAARAAYTLCRDRLAVDDGSARVA
jgi:hypothetical protein